MYYSHIKKYLCFKKLLTYRVLLEQLMGLLSMHAFLLSNKYHIEVVGKHNVFKMLWQFMILTWSLAILLLDEKKQLMLQEFWLNLFIAHIIIFKYLHQVNLFIFILLNNLYLFIILINLTLIFLDKYYLVGATYTHFCGLMALYCNVWY